MKPEFVKSIFPPFVPLCKIFTTLSAISKGMKGSLLSEREVQYLMEASFKPKGRRRTRSLAARQERAKQR